MCLAEACLRVFHSAFNHLMWQLDVVFGLRRRVKKVRIFRAWFSHGSGAVPALDLWRESLFHV